jgi:serine-type D-Ala-D-Ala carboxypeptidase (penicillin-binding protein 5/6)
VSLLGLVTLAPAAAAEGTVQSQSRGTFLATTSAVGGAMLASRGIVVAPGDTRLPPVKAGSWLIADMDSGKVLAARDAHGLYRPASTLKTLTALTLLPLLAKKQVYVAQAVDASVEGSKVGLFPGAKYTVDQLFYGLFLPSGNDAASALANVYGGWAKTVLAMRATAANINALDTHVVNPSGLDAPGQFTSAYDLALISRAGLARPDFAGYVSTKVFQFPGKMPAKRGAGRPTYQIQNENRLLQQGFPGTIGVKTGYTTLAGRTFVAAVRRGGHTILVTLMHIQDQTVPAAESLVTWGFDNFGRPGVGTLVAPGPLPESESPSPPPTAKAVHAAPTDRSGFSGGAIWLAAGLVALTGGTYWVLGRSRVAGVDPQGGRIGRLRLRRGTRGSSRRTDRAMVDAARRASRR